jgi:hypothetical protein
LLKSDAMKNYLKSLVCLLLVAFLAPVSHASNHPGDYYGLPGDDFSLEGALDLFKSCNSLEDFERELNSPEVTVNNLDLNNNGRIDYLRVVDHAEGDLHAIVIQALIDNGLSQDVAVIEVKRNRHGEAVIQIIGDEDLYGTAKIVEPYPYDDVAGPDYYYDNDDYYDRYNPQVFVNVWAWPTVRFIFAPRYVVWVSPYYYDYYPVWYSPWRPHPYHVWHTRTVVYHRHYCVAPEYRIPEAHHYYGARRVYAPVVHQRTERYVAEHGGRANFTHGKRSDVAPAPNGRSLDRSDKAAVSARNERELGTGTKEQNPRDKGRSTQPEVAQPKANDRNLDKSAKPATAGAVDRKQREHDPAAQSFREPNTKGQSFKEQNTKEQTPRTKPSNVKPEVSDRNRQPKDSKPKLDSNSRQNASPSREATPRGSSSLKEQSRSTKASPQVAPRTESKPAAAPKLNRSTEQRSSRSTSSGASLKTSTKNESGQARKGKG